MIATFREGEQYHLIAVLCETCIVECFLFRFHWLQLLTFFWALQELDRLLQSFDLKNYLHSRICLLQENLVCLGTDIMIEVLSRKTVSDAVASARFLVFGSWRKELVDSTLVTTEQGSVFLLVVLKFFQASTWAQVCNTDCTICRGTYQKTAFFSIYWPSILVSNKQCLYGRSPVAINQCNRQNIILNFLKHRHNANPAVVSSNN